MKIYRIVYWLGSITTEAFVKADSKEGAIAEFEKAMGLIKDCDSKLKEAEDTIAKIVDENNEIVDFNQE